MSEKEVGKSRDRAQSRLDFTVFEDQKGVRQSTLDYCLKQLGKAQKEQGRESEQ